jgi:hypothetical protein
MSILTKTLPFPQGEIVSLVRDSDDWFIFIPPEDWANSENTIMFVAKDKKAYNRLVNKLQQVIIQIKLHNEECECD